MSSEGQKTEDRLLCEYEVCMQYATHHSNLIWQTASIFLSVSLVGLAYFSTNKPGDLLALLARALIYIGAVIMIEGWFYLFRRWDGYVAISFYRMKEIEANLGMMLVRYGHHIRTFKHNNSIPEVSEGDMVHFRSLQEDERFAEFPRLTQHYVIRLITRLLEIGWLLIFVIDVISL